MGKSIDYGDLLEVNQENVQRLCDEEKTAGRIPQYTQIRGKFISPYSHLIQRYWAEWISENEEFVASKKGAKYGYKKLYEQTLIRAEALEDAVKNAQTRLGDVCKYLVLNCPEVYKAMEDYLDGCDK